MAATKNIKYYLDTYIKKYNSFLSKKNLCSVQGKKDKYNSTQKEIGKIIAYLDTLLVKKGNVALGDLTLSLEYEKFKNQLENVKEITKD